MINWPAWADRTPPSDRKQNTSLSATLAATSDDLRTEMTRLDPDEWRVETASGGSYTTSSGLPKHNANPSDPGVVLRWTDGGTDHAVVCDRWSRLRDNLRTVYYWMRETRKRSNRPVQTGRGDFAAAQLPSPSGGDEAIAAREPAHEVLGVSRDASDDEVRSAYRDAVTDAHPDQGGSREALQRLRDARDALLGGDGS